MENIDLLEMKMSLLIWFTSYADKPNNNIPYRSNLDMFEKNY
jgi:hypothetical protein